MPGRVGIRVGSSTTLNLIKREFDEAFPLRYSALLPPNFGGLSDKIFRSKSPDFGGFRGLLE